jgi:hypothetical protein
MLHDPVFLHFLAVEYPGDGLLESLLFISREFGHVWSPSGCLSITVIHRAMSHSEKVLRVVLQQNF